MFVERAEISDSVAKTLCDSGIGLVQMGIPKKRTKSKTEVTFILNYMDTVYIWSADDLTYIRSGKASQTAR